MPELPEVETVRLGLAPVLEGRRVLAIERRAKYLIWHLEGGEALLVHLGMSGRVRVWHAPPPAPGRHDHVDLATDRGATVRFTDPRRFGLIVLAKDAGLERHPLLAGLGVEPLADGFDGAWLAARLKGRRTSIKAALMDQRLVAGLGNIYACEALFRARLSPRRRAGTVAGGRARGLVEAIRAVLAEAIQAGGSSLRDHRQPSGEFGYFQHRFQVYDREGEACPGCRCDVARTGGIRRIVQGGRSTFHCPLRQR